MDMGTKSKILDEIEIALGEVMDQDDSMIRALDIPEDVLAAAARAATETIDIYLLGLKHGEENNG